MDTADDGSHRQVSQTNECRKLDASREQHKVDVYLGGTVKRHSLGERHVIEVNKSGVICLTLNNEGTLLAVASEKGTIVRLYDTTLNRLQYEFRRGTIPANIQYLKFDTCSKFLVCASDRSKVHVFKVSENNTYHNLYYLKYLINIAGSQWSFYQCQLEGEDSTGGSKAIIYNNKVHIITKSAKHLTHRLTEEGGLLPIEQEQDLAILGKSNMFTSV